MESINAKYVSQKISKIRWRPVSYSALQQPDIFVSGSWDNEVGTFHDVVMLMEISELPTNVILDVNN